MEHGWLVHVLKVKLHYLLTRGNFISDAGEALWRGRVPRIAQVHAPSRMAGPRRHNQDAFLLVVSSTS